ncbi:aminoimidazole riboside kinase [Ammoniphilus sp. YIM 78166]|uniref:aminoimidazole riboside kinase n=1 Tax=Ammoniphilus sp. YIM 78166 TaxID=1644106 RepID=UPI0010700715|nr:aminoimidazole riboside kinase [Ammoniphilus sp. YIM 78166]
MKTGVISLGEALIDFIPLDPTNSVYQKSPGGAPANVAVGLARLGVPATFLGKVGDDVLGRFLEGTLTEYGVNTDFMPLTDEARTGAVFVTLAENGERSFDFYIIPSADAFLNEQDVKEEIFASHKILHFGSISLIREPSRSATKKAVQLAKAHGMLISYDPNLRIGLWDSEQQAKEIIESMLPEADILKISEEELEFLTGEQAINKGVQALEAYQIPLVFVTLGEKGSIVYTRQGEVHVPALPVQAVDTTGAGDAYVSGVLYCLNECEEPLRSLTVEEAEKIARFASVSGALAASTKGAMTALPTLAEVKGRVSK